MLPIEVEHKLFRLQHFSEEQLNDSQVNNLTRLELREVTVIQSIKNQQAMRRYHARNVCSRNFQVGDFVLWKTQTTKVWHKLSPIWEKSKYQILGMTIG
jgi:hypothetical protein